MLRTKLAKKVLTKEQQRHLTEDAGINSMAKMQIQVEFMKEHPRGCIHCEIIAKKLGMVK